ncbi:MAG: hypothetical protein R3F56_00065 [Planctomycetota bacterium]
MLSRLLLAGALVAGPCSSPILAQSLGPAFTIRSSPTIIPQVCDVTYDVTRDVYGVVFGRADGTLRVQRFRASGTLVGDEVNVGSGYNARIVDLNLRNRFVVLWQSGDAILARIVDPASGLTSGTVTLASSVTAWSMDAAGDATTVDDDVLVVYCSDRLVLGAQLNVSATFQLQVVSQVPIRVGSASTSYARITESVGPSGRLLVAWSEASATSTRILGTVITKELGVLRGAFSIDPSGPEGREVRGIDGDGENFVVAYTKREPANTGISDVFARAVSFDFASGTTHVGGQQAIEADANDNEGFPTVAFTGSSHLVAYIDGTVSQSDVHGRSVEPFACRLCEQRFGLDSNNVDAGYLCASVAERAAGASTAVALVVWTRQIGGGSGTTIRGRLYTPEVGTSRQLGGGCGGGGTAYAACSRHGNSEFRLRVKGALPGNALVVLSPRRIDMACTACTLVPDPLVGVLLNGTVDSTGAGEVRLPIPNSTGLIGGRVYAQWLALRASGPCPLIAAHLSTAIEVEIQ